VRDRGLAIAARDRDQPERGVGAAGRVLIGAARAGADLERVGPEPLGLREVVQREVGVADVAERSDADPSGSGRPRWRARPRTPRAPARARR
jgi:hypothetical protein